MLVGTVGNDTTAVGKTDSPGDDCRDGFVEGIGFVGADEHACSMTSVPINSHGVRTAAERKTSPRGYLRASLDASETT